MVELRRFDGAKRRRFPLTRLFVPKSGVKGNRTLDLCNAIAALYQLSYNPIFYILNHAFVQRKRLKRRIQHRFLHRRFLLKNFVRGRRVCYH